MAANWSWSFPGPFSEAKSERVGPVILTRVLFCAFVTAPQMVVYLPLPSKTDIRSPLVSLAFMASPSYTNSPSG